MPSPEDPLSLAGLPTSFKPGRVVDDLDLRKILNAGRLAPSTFNFQPWLFAVFRNGDRDFETVLKASNFDLSQWTYAPVLVVGWFVDELPSRVEDFRGDPHYCEGLDDVAAQPFLRWIADRGNRIDWGKRQTTLALERMAVTAATLGHCTNHAWGADEQIINALVRDRSANVSLAGVLAIGKDSVWSNNGTRRPAHQVILASQSEVAGPPTTYRKAIVSLIDVLGFKELVRQNSVGGIETLLTLFHRTSGTGDPGSARRSGLRVHQFSDLTARLTFMDALDYPDCDPLYLEIVALMRMQLDVLDAGALIRGGVASGEVAIAGQQCFGPALIEAADMDKGRPPRIGLAPSCTPRLQSNGLRTLFGMRAEADLLRTDDWAESRGLKGQGELFVDYLKGAMEDDQYALKLAKEDPDRTLPINRGFPVRGPLAVRHADLIGRMVNNSDSRVRAKAGWLRDYHLATQAQFLSPNDIGWLR